MRAVRYDQYGPPEVLHLTETPVPEPGSGEVLVEVHGASANGGETAIRAGKLRRLVRQPFPRGVGVDFAGQVASVGAGVRRIAVGQAVWGLVPHGTFGSVADYVVVPEPRLAATPSGLDLVQAAALPAAGTTAITALVEEARLRSGERLLVRGASGGVGSIAVQLGKALGAQVTTLTGSRNLDWVRDLGADVALDYRTTRPIDLGEFDVVLDTVGTELPAYRARLARNGRMVALAIDTVHIARSFVFVALGRFARTRRVHAFTNNPPPERLAELTRRVEAGEIRPVVDTVFPMSATADSHRHLEAGGVRGKYVITTRPDAEPSHP